MHFKSPIIWVIAGVILALFGVLLDQSSISSAPMLAGILAGTWGAVVGLTVNIFKHGKE